MSKGQRFLICQDRAKLQINSMSSCPGGNNGEGDKGTEESREWVQRSQDPALLGPGEIPELGLPIATSLLKPDYIKNAQSLFPTKLMELGLCYMPVSAFL